MNKYELALVLNAKVEDDVRTAALEKAKGYIARYGGTITNVDEWGKKKLAYEIQKMREGLLLLHSVLKRMLPARQSWKDMYASWITFFAT